VTGVSSPEEIIQEHNIDTSQIKLLLVEDEKMLMRFSVKKFAELGFNVTEATDGAQALHLMRTQQFDVVLMDQNMPQLGGLESIRRFREWQRRATRRGSSYRADAEGARSDHRDSHTASFSVGSEEAMIHRPSETDARTGRMDEPPEHSPLIFMMSGSILDADKTEADELCVLDFFEKPLHVSLVAARILSHIVQHPTRLDRVRRQTTASTR
jgi:CheY-like chemotaxis protein